MVLVQDKKDRFNYFHTTKLKDKPAFGPQFHQSSARHDIFGKNLKLTLREKFKDSADIPWPENNTIRSTLSAECSGYHSHGTKSLHRLPSA